MVDASTCFLVCAAHAWDSVDMKSEDPVSTQVDGDLWRLHSQASSGSGYRDSCLKVGALSQVVTPTPESLRWLKSHTLMCKALDRQAQDSAHKLEEGRAGRQGEEGWLRDGQAIQGC